MTFTAAQKSVLKNLDLHAEQRDHSTQAYAAKCFEHVLGIYLEFGAYRIFRDAIDTYNGSLVVAYHDFSEQMFMRGISHDDFRLPELMTIVAQEIRANPTGPLNLLMQKPKAKFYGIVLPRLLDDDRKLRFSLNDYLTVHQASLERSMPEAIKDQAQHESLAFIMHAIHDEDDHHFERLAEQLKPHIYREALGYSNVVRLAVLGEAVDSAEILGRLRCMAIEPAPAETGDLSFSQTSTFLDLVDNQIRLHGLAPDLFTGSCDFLLKPFVVSGNDTAPHTTRLSDMILFLLDELGQRGIDFEKEVIARCMEYLKWCMKYHQSLTVAAQKMGKFNETLSTTNDVDHEEIQATCALAVSYENLGTPVGRLKCLVAGLTLAEHASPWLGQFLSKLIDRFDLHIIEQATLTDLEALGLYRHTGQVRDLQRIRSGAVRDRAFGADLGL